MGLRLYRKMPDETPKLQQQADQTQEDADPREDFGMEEFLLADGGESECGGEDDVEVENGKRRNQEILLVDAAEMHRVAPASFQ
jgi:hypothetical protein